MKLVKTNQICLVEPKKGEKYPHYAIEHNGKVMFELSHFQDPQDELVEVEMRTHSFDVNLEIVDFVAEEGAINGRGKWSCTITHLGKPMVKCTNDNDGCFASIEELSHGGVSMVHTMCHVWFSHCMVNSGKRLQNCEVIDEVIEAYVMWKKFFETNGITSYDYVKVVSQYHHD